MTDELPPIDDPLDADRGGDMEWNRPLYPESAGLVPWDVGAGARLSRMVLEEHGLYPDSITRHSHVWGEPRSSLLPALVELHRFFLEYRGWFNQKLPLPVITIQTAGRRAALGWHSERRWKQAHLGNLLTEINICPEYLCEDLEEVGHTMIHEMVHYANFRVGKRDCNANQYHNRFFKERAEEVGLTCGAERHRRFGWGLTSLTPVARQRIAAIALDKDAFTLFRGSFVTAAAGAAAAPPPPPEPKLRNWKCQCVGVPGLWRATDWPVPFICPDCGVPFQPVR